MHVFLEPTTDLKPCHIRMARSGLDLTVRELAVLSEVNKATIVRTEAGLAVRDSTWKSIVDTLEKQGASFQKCAETHDVFVGIKVI